MKNYRRVQTNIKTNNGLTQAWRAPNHPQACAITHVAIDDLAMKMGANSLDIFMKNVGTDASPLTSEPVPPPHGQYQAMLDQPFPQPLLPFQSDFNPVSGYSGSHALYQDFTIPLNATSAKLSFSLYLNSATAWTDASGNPDLDYRTGTANQQVRVDIMTTTGDVSNPNGVLGVLGVTAYDPANPTTSGNVLRNLVQTLSTDAIAGTRTFSGATAFE